eukprot:s157_g31.t1
MAWSDSKGMHTEELVFPPVQLTKLTATYLVHALVRTFAFLADLDKYLEEASKVFKIIQFQLLQGSSLRASVAKAMQQELKKRYRFHRVFAIPSRATNSAKFRANLTELIYGSWDVSVVALEVLSTSSSVRLNLHHLFHHFNGNLKSEDSWEHWCTGPDCCKDADDSLRKAWRSPKYHLN